MGKQGQKISKAKKQRRRKTIVYYYRCNRCGRRFVRRPKTCPKCHNSSIVEIR